MGRKEDKGIVPVLLFSFSSNDSFPNRGDITKQSSPSLSQTPTLQDKHIYAVETQYNYSRHSQQEGIEGSSSSSGSNILKEVLGATGNQWLSLFIPTVSASSGTAVPNPPPSSLATFLPEPVTLLAHVRMEHLLAGVTGGVASTLILHPLDLVKIRFAVNDGLSSRPQYNGLTHAFKSILKTEGFKGLYRGVTPNVWGAGSAWGLYFLFYNSLKTWWQCGDTKTDLGPTRHMIIAAEAGLLTLMITNPIWVVKTRLCLQYGSVPTLPAGVAVAGAPIGATYYSGMTDALVKVYQMEGVRGLYRGFIPGMFGVSHGAIQFMTYEEMKTVYNKHRNMPIDAKLGTVEYLSFAAVSKLIAAGTTYPYQVVRARLQDQHRVYEGVMDVIRQTWRNEGFRGFYKGLVPNLIRVVPATAITFVVYEKSSTYLNSFRKPEILGASANTSVDKK